MEKTGTLGIIVNPHSGRDARRLFARAGTSTIDDKRNQVTRIVVGAAASGIKKILLSRDAFRITTAATEALSIEVDCELVEHDFTGHGADSQRSSRQPWKCCHKSVPSAAAPGATCSLSRRQNKTQNRALIRGLIGPSRDDYPVGTTIQKGRLPNEDDYSVGTTIHPGPGQGPMGQGPMGQVWDMGPIR